MQRKHEKLKKINSFFITLLISVLISLTIRALFCPILVSGDSMNPTYTDGEILICTKDTSQIEKGDIVILKIPHQPQLIKRVVGIPGDELNVIDGLLYINGFPSEWQFDLIEDENIGEYLSSPLFLGEDQFFCMGDNRNHSTDCREFGPVSKTHMKYKVKKRLFK